jgi:hypothetical protein
VNINAMSLSAALSTVRCSDPEEFGAMLPDFDRRVLPLITDFSFFQAELQLGRLRLVIVKRPPASLKRTLRNRRSGSRCR